MFATRRPHWAGPRLCRQVAPRERRLSWLLLPGIGECMAWVMCALENISRRVLFRMLRDSHEVAVHRLILNPAQILAIADAICGGP